MTEPEDFVSLKGTTIPRKISVEYISFSAHVDYSQNSEFIEAVKAQHVVCPFHRSLFSVFTVTEANDLGPGTRRTDSHGPLTRSHDISI